jgi:hypothetical protein
MTSRRHLVQISWAPFGFPRCPLLVNLTDDESLFKKLYTNELEAISFDELVIYI